MCKIHCPEINLKSLRIGLTHFSTVGAGKPDTLPRSRLVEDADESGQAGQTGCKLKTLSASGTGGTEHPRLAA